ncbi:hypothetical protein EIP91_000528 [Steccherinum ochraceum]|uniref:Roadblock/LAMTOR2 domain-containing protein n=1 Tax=Steccherinum ochraceum TaxID=92696 RepID=A0A4R0RXZ4_9APHY|nr:hypothetical protein EIP91_000528 [Steccherinum ochraceum]
MSLKSIPSNPAFPLSQSHDAQNTVSTSASGPHIPAEFEQTLTLLTSHRSVLGYLLLSRSQPVTIIRHSGVVFEGEQGRKYAQAVGRIVESVQTGLEEVAGDSTDTDEIRFMRIRTKRHEIMISPNERFLLAVLHDPAT